MKAQAPWMKRRQFASALTITAVVALSGVLTNSAQAQTGHSNGNSALAFTTKTPYEPQGNLKSYQRPPSGYQPVFTENVSRHGSRTLSDSDDGDALLALWKIAQAENALTPRGRGLGPEVQQLLDANAAIGYGLLTASGKQEIADTAVRMERRLPGLFKDVAKGSGRIDVVAASQQRTVDSATAFVDGLISTNPKLAPAISPVRTDDNLLYFHKSAANQDYQNYVKNDPRVAAAESAARDQPRTHTVARDVLLRSFTPAFVQRLAAGDYAAEFADEIDAAEAVYNLDAVTKDMPAEGHWHMDRYISVKDASWFGYLDDVTSFYENGPAFSGDNITYKMANVLLDDMFAQLDAKRDGTSNLAAELRFTHAEEIFPLATLLQLPGSTKQLPAGTVFTYANDPFRGAQIAPMGANIQWDMFKKGNSYLVRMLYNEKQTAFKASCKPVRKGSYFYDLTALERCYGYSH
jgi:hypothetical protein